MSISCPSTHCSTTTIELGRQVLVHRQVRIRHVVLVRRGKHTVREVRYIRRIVRRKVFLSYGAAHVVDNTSGARRLFVHLNKRGIVLLGQSMRTHHPVVLAPRGLRQLAHDAGHPLHPSGTEEAPRQKEGNGPQGAGEEEVMNAPHRRQPKLAVAAALVAATLLVPGLAASAAASAAQVAHHSAKKPIPAKLAHVIQRALGGSGLVTHYLPNGGVRFAAAAKHSLQWSLVPEGIARGQSFSPARGDGQTQKAVNLGPFSAWYHSSPAGIEQGFTIARRPAGVGWKLAIVLRSSGTLTPHAAGPSSISLRAPDGSAVFSYDGLVVRDAAGKMLPSHLMLSRHTVRIVVDARRADYPITVDPTVQEALLTATNGATGDRFGYAVAISSNGSTAVVGAPYHQVGSNAGQGEAVVFSGTNWGTQTDLTATNGAANDNLGYAVAISSSGSTVVAGAPFHQVGSNAGQGEAVVFSGTNWGTQTDLTATNGAASDAVGDAVAVSSNGSTIVAGAPNHQVGSNTRQGEAVVFSGTNWGTQTDLTATNGAASDAFGNSVAISSNGSTVVAGAPFHQVGSNSGQGEAVVFSGTNWGTQSDLTATNGAANDDLGMRVAISSDGSTVVVGAPFHRVGPNADQGEVVVFSGANWGTQSDLTATNGAAVNDLGRSVAISANGATITAGAPYHTVGPNADQGEAVTYDVITPVTVTVSGSQTYGSSSPSFTYATSPSGVSVSGLSCTKVGSATAIGSSLASGSYTILGSSCSGTATSNYSLSFTGATNGFSVAAKPAPPSSPAPTNTGTGGGSTGGGTTPTGHRVPPRVWNRILLPLRRGPQRVVALSISCPSTHCSTTTIELGRQMLVRRRVRVRHVVFVRRGKHTVREVRYIRRIVRRKVFLSYGAAHVVDNTSVQRRFLVHLNKRGIVLFGHSMRTHHPVVLKLLEVSGKSHTARAIRFIPRAPKKHLVRKKATGRKKVA